MAHTPGPWEIEWDAIDDETPWPAWLQAGEKHLLTFEDATAADARLIAAARALLEAALDITNGAMPKAGGAWEILDSHIEQLRAAIQKAKGE